MKAPQAYLVHARHAQLGQHAHCPAPPLAVAAAASPRGVEPLLTAAVLLRAGRERERALVGLHACSVGGGRGEQPRAEQPGAARGASAHVRRDGREVHLVRSPLRHECSARQVGSRCPEHELERCSPLRACERAPRLPRPADKRGSLTALSASHRQLPVLFQPWADSSLHASTGQAVCGDAWRARRKLWEPCLACRCRSMLR